MSDKPTVTIEGEEYPMILGRPALRMFARQEDMEDVGNQELVDLLGKISIRQADKLNWCCLKCGAAAEDKEFPYSFEEFQELLDKDPALIEQMDEIAAEQSPKEAQAERTKASP